MKASNGVFLFGKYIVPIISPFLSYKRCVQCILILPKGGGELCDYCKQIDTQMDTKAISLFKEKLAHERKKLNQFIHGDRKAIILFSGGKDSIYLTLRLLEEHPTIRERIDCLLLIDTGFMSPIAITNAQTFSKKIGINLVHETSHISHFRKALRGALLSLKHGEVPKGTYEVVDYVEGSLIFNIGEAYAKRRYIINGITQAQMEIIGKDDEKEKQLSFLYPMALWAPSEKEVIEKVSSYIKTSSVLETNSTLIEALAVVDVYNLGHSSFETEFALQVRNGLAHRKEWLPLFAGLKVLVELRLLDTLANKALKSFNLTLADVKRLK